MISQEHKSNTFEGFERTRKVRVISLPTSSR
jgi:hypothetical protein